MINTKHEITDDTHSLHVSISTRSVLIQSWHIYIHDLKSISREVKHYSRSARGPPSHATVIWSQAAFGSFVCFHLQRNISYFIENIWLRWAAESRLDVLSFTTRETLQISVSSRMSSYYGTVMLIPRSISWCLLIIEIISQWPQSPEEAEAACSEIYG